ncbi:MAG TPA: DinB family protein, partial [Gemmatimonadaceae bacterium]|nr:DinB family protein [Gemmatimonadaceae bacterium]
PGKWSPAQVAMHVCRAYELGSAALHGGDSMRLRVSERYAWWLRTLMMPVVLATRRFPRGAPAPREVWPEGDVTAFTPDATRRRLEKLAPELAAGLHRSAAKPGSPRFTHAYFGMLTPYDTLRLLAAHTRHHERGLAYAARTVF